MISEVVDPPERLRDAAQELAEKIARNSPAAMAATKRALWGALELGLTDACKAGRGELVSMWGHPDQEEGPRAFAEKREPQWQPLDDEKRRSDRGRDRHRGHRVHRAARGRGARRSTVGTNATTCTPRRPAGPGAFSGARWVATRACKAVRPPDATWFGDPARGSFLTTVWLLDGCAAGVGRVGRSPDGGARARSPIACSRAATTSTPRCIASRTSSGPVTASSAATALDHPFAGVIVLAVNAAERAGGDARRSSAPRSRSRRCSRRSACSWRRASAPPHDLVLGFTAGDPHRGVARAGRTRARVACPTSASRARSSVLSPAPTPTSGRYEPRSCTSTSSSTSSGTTARGTCTT